MEGRNTKSQEGSANSSSSSSAANSTTQYNDIIELVFDERSGKIRMKVKFLCVEKFSSLPLDKKNVDRVFSIETKLGKKFQALNKKGKKRSKSEDNEFKNINKLRSSIMKALKVVRCIIEGKAVSIDCFEKGHILDAVDRYTTHHCKISESREEREKEKRTAILKQHKEIVESQQSKEVERVEYQVDYSIAGKNYCALQKVVEESEVDVFSDSDVCAFENHKGYTKHHLSSFCLTMLSSSKEKDFLQLLKENVKIEIHGKKEEEDMCEYTQRVMKAICKKKGYGNSMAIVINKCFEAFPSITMKHKQTFEDIHEIAMVSGCRSNKKLDYIKSIYKKREAELLPENMNATSLEDLTVKQLRDGAYSKQ